MAKNYTYTSYNRFYFIANSFSEENYWMYTEWTGNEGPMFASDQTKIKDKIITKYYSLNADGSLAAEPYNIKYINQIEKTCFKLTLS